jgi:hypothetical protein
MLIDELHDIAKSYYASDWDEKRELDSRASTVIFTYNTPRTSLYHDMYSAFKEHYKNEFYNKQMRFTYE